MMMGSSRRSLLAVSALLFFCLFSGPSWQAAAVTNPTDVTALRDLYSYWSKPYSSLPTNWVGDDPCGANWQGVSCDNNAEHVTGLFLQKCNLTGGIPPQIGNLTSLLNLDLSYNGQLGGRLPQEFGELKSLQQMFIMYCGLIGGIPDALTQLVNLTNLGINGNSLAGQIPANMGNLQKLVWFDISENQFNGSLPIASTTSVGLDNLTNCQHFHFFNNSLSGEIPKEIFNLPKLLHMLLYSNAFHGAIPTSTLSNPSSLLILRLDNNFLDGAVPPELNQLTTLTELSLANNSFTQSLPDLSALTGLLLLDVSHNSFDPQEVPGWVYSLNATLTIVMDSTNLTGNLNPSIFSLPALQSVSLSNNALNGSVDVNNPSTTLKTINLQDNEFSGLNVVGGTISILFAGNPFCINLADNQGVCRRNVSGSTTPATTWVAPENQSCLRVNCGEGQDLNPQRCSCAYPLACNMKLTSPPFSFINNTIITTISNEYANYFNLDPSQVYISSANFTNDGWMLFNLFFFPLSGDSLDTTVVGSIRNNLSSNTAPLTVGGPYIMLSFTNPLLGNSSKGTKIGIGVIIGIVVAAIVVALIIALIVVYAIRQKKRADKAETSRPFASWGTTARDSGEAPQLKGARWFSLAELKKATNDWNEDNEVGAGGYGKVYRGELPGGGVVAVKRAEEGSVQGAVEFKNEIELLSRVHHRNLVGLVGFCYEHGEQALVYEYMPNGSLRDHLLGQFELPLSWDMRVAIALGSAKGLAYLHELANPPIIHRDIKSGNILLDEKMVAKVADFGLSKLAPENADKKGHLSTQVKGTLGYLDPEYYMTNQLSAKSDVYSFGVVLLEMLSARPPIERGKYIVREVRTALDKGGIRALEPLLDPFLGDYPPKQLEAFLDLALLCVDEVGAGRPTMNSVVKKLEVIIGNSQPKSGVHITVEPRKADGIYGKEYLEKATDPSFQYSGASFTAHANVEPK